MERDEQDKIFDANESYTGAIKAAMVGIHEHYKSKEIKKGKHPTSECPKGKQRQDPPVCPECSHLLEPFEKLNMKTKQELYDKYAFVIKPLMDIILKQLKILKTIQRDIDSL
jgi:hypothetical protein